MKHCDPNEHKSLIDLLTEYKHELSTQVNDVPLLNSLINKISWCILENDLKAPKEVTELVRTLNVLLYKDPTVFLINTIL
ncbi:bacteriocin immunity protein [Sporolactobacillus laevolacticus]|uniref:bacteriocin immunity protein n=1 Tax=Sporolactobacillus laevolacticus TaxID=33018 RepID=UPI000A07A014